MRSRIRNPEKTFNRIPYTFNLKAIESRVLELVIGLTPCCFTYLLTWVTWWVISVGPVPVGPLWRCCWPVLPPLVPLVSLESLVGGCKNSVFVPSVGIFESNQRHWFFKLFQLYNCFRTGWERRRPRRPPVRAWYWVWPGPPLHRPHPPTSALSALHSALALPGII
jgi:hypothetical protein